MRLAIATDIPENHRLSSKTLVEFFENRTKGGDPGPNSGGLYEKTYKGR